LSKIDFITFYIEDVSKTFVFSLSQYIEGEY